MTGKPLGGFIADLDKFGEKLGIDLRIVRRKIALDLLRKITDRTPVDTGRLRASWNLSDDQPDPSVAPKGINTGTGKITATFTRPFGQTWISNNLPYALKIEFDGHSKQAPSGMARISVAEIEAELEATLERF